MRRTENNYTIVCYDFTNNKLRRRFEKTLRDFGKRAQYSVFACRLTAERQNDMRRKLTAILNSCRALCAPTDSVIILSRVPFDKVENMLGAERMRENDFEIY
jgi:CRISPR-associated endonuclease Cas2